MKKGIVLAWGGILAICLIATFVIIYATQVKSVKIATAIKTGDIISFSNDVELYRKMLPESTVFISQYSAYEKGKAGGGAADWTSTSPTEDQLKQSLLTEITNNIGKEFTDEKNKVTFSDTTLQISGKDNNNFILSGSMKMKAYNDELKATSTSKITLDTEVPSSYFKLITIGMNIVGNEQYAIKKSNYKPNADGTFNVINNNDMCNNIVPKTTPYSDSLYYYTNIENLAGISILCGYKNNPGIASVTTNDASVVSGLAAAVITSLNSDLTSKYGLTVTITRTDFIQNLNKFTIKLSTKIEDPSSIVYVTTGTDILKLIFNLPQIVADLKYYDINAKDIIFTGTVMPKGISLFVKNEGTLMMTNVKYRVYVGGNSVGTGTIASINPATTLTIATGATVSASGKNVQIVVDTDYTYAEINEANNWVSRTS